MKREKTLEKTYKKPAFKTRKILVYTRSRSKIIDDTLFLALEVKD